MVESSDQIKRAKESLIDLTFDNDVATIEKIISAGFPVNEPINANNQTVLHLAILINRQDVVDLLLTKMEPDVNQQDYIGRSVLHYACRQGNLKMIQQLLALDDVDTELRTMGGETPLMHACQSGDLECVVECLDNNMNPFQQNSLKQTARDQAEMFKNVYGQNLRTILDAGIDQWKQQVTQDVIDANTQDPKQFFEEFIPVN